MITRLTKAKIEFIKFIQSDEGLRHFADSFFSQVMPAEIAKLVCNSDGSDVEIRRLLMLDHIDDTAVVIGIVKAEGERFKIQMTYPLPLNVNEHALLFAVEDMSPELNELPSPN
ncbi:MAG: hypothetical protein R8G60_13125 [Roseovarius pacificus]|nr:hypothetical protein [Roseovarius pacificus]